MLERIDCPNGVVIYRSPLLAAAGVPHAFSTRRGGVSPPPFDALNLGRCPGDLQDDPANLAENYRRLLTAAGLGGREHVYLHQIHSAVVHTVPAGGPFDCDSQGDALVTDDPARALSVRVADCLPVLLASADGRRVAVVHAGWRGVVGGAVTAVGAGFDVAAIGPGIGFNAFEVGPEVVAAFRETFGDGPWLRESGGKGHIDLAALVERQLRGIGVGRIDRTDRCTHRDAGEFFSHRRDGAPTGRGAAVIGPAACGFAK